MTTITTRPPSTLQSWMASLNRQFLPLAIPLGFLLIAAILFLVPAEEWTNILVYGAVLVLLATFLYRNHIAADHPSFPVSLFVLALLVKLMGSLARYWTIVDLYDGSADAMHYYGQGQNIARYFAAGDFSIIDTYTFKGAGTTWMVHVTALVYTLLPVSVVGSFFLFAGFAFAGSVLHYHAFRMALPDQRSRLYAFLLFFSPSILFWPSSLGKDAWIFLWTGVVMWGWAIYIQRGRLSGLIAIAISLFLINLIRPHIAAFLALSLAGVFLFIGTGRPRSLATWLVSGALLVALAGMMLVSGADYLRLDSLSVEAVSEFYEDQQVTSFGGGSAFQPPNVFNPIGAVYGIITTLFRPFPWEAHNAQSLVTALEGVFWIGLVWLRRKVLWARIRAVHRSPVLAFALVYSLIMALAMTVSGNFAIIARQRLMFLPLFWMLLG